jgi:hypothetical protein
MNCETLAVLTARAELFAAAPFLKPMELACQRMHQQVKRSGCFSCRGRRNKEELNRVFCRVAASFFELAIKAKSAGGNMAGLQQYLVKLAGKNVAGIEMAVPIDGKAPRVVF